MMLRCTSQLTRSGERLAGSRLTNSAAMPMTISSSGVPTSDSPALIAWSATSHAVVKVSRLPSAVAWLIASFNLPNSSSFSAGTAIP